MSRIRVFLAIFAGYGLFGPPIGGLLVLIGAALFSQITDTLNRDFFLPWFSLSYATGLMPALASGFYLARRATGNRPFMRRSYYLTALISALLFPVCILIFMVSSGAVFYPPSDIMSTVFLMLGIPMITAAFISDAFLRVVRFLLRRTPYSLRIAPREPLPQPREV